MRGLFLLLHVTAAVPDELIDCRQMILTIDQNRLL
jgi:hypothetical protein